MEVDIEITCCMCSATFKTSAILPHGWAHRYGEIDDRLAFCDEHAKIAEWADAQCPGCVGSWHDCSLWHAFAYGRITLTEQDLAVIATGRCPKRTNGTFVLSPDKGFQSDDLQEQATSESGQALVSAIRQYWETYKNV